MSNDRRTVRSLALALRTFLLLVAAGGLHPVLAEDGAAQAVPTETPTPRSASVKAPRWELSPQFNADLVSQADPNGPVVFKFRRQDEVKGDVRTVDSAYLTPDGEVVVTERAVLRGGKLMETEFVQKQIKEHGTIKVVGNELRFEYHKDGQVLTDSEKLRDNLVVPLVVPDFIFFHWDQLMAGQGFDLRIALVERQETVGIHLVKQEETANRVTFKMSANSMFVALFAPTVEVVYDKASRRMLRSTSPVAARVLEKGRWNGLRSIMKAQ